MTAGSACEMFVYYYVHLGLPFEDAEQRLLSTVHGLEDFAAAAYREGEEMRSRLGVGGDHSPIAKIVRIDAGPPGRGNLETSVPITWEAVGTPGLFPRMDGELVLARMGPELTQLAFRGSYTPPLGAVGRAFDRTLFHRFAEASVKGFVDRLARALTETVSLSAP